MLPLRIRSAATPSVVSPGIVLNSGSVNCVIGGMWSRARLPRRSPPMTQLTMPEAATKLGIG